MQYFDLTLRFDDGDHSLTSKNGLLIDQLGELLLSLSKAANSDADNPITLSEIRGNCYALQVSTPVETVYETLKVVHTKISRNEFSGLNADQKKYANKLKVIMGNNLSLSVYDKKLGFEVSISEIIAPKQIDYYFEIGSIYGTITAIGGNSLSGKSVIHVSKISYDIEISAKQESEIIKFYKKNRVRFLVNKKVSVDKKEIVSAKLEDFEVIDEPRKFNEADIRNKIPNDFLDKLASEYYSGE